MSFVKACSHYQRGELPTQYHAGDIGLTMNPNKWYTSQGFTSGCIRFDQRLVFRGEDRVYTKYSHAFVCLDDKGTIAEALARGICVDNISKYKEKEFSLVHLNMSEQNAAQAVSFANSVVNDKYAWLTIPAIALNSFTGSKLALAWGNHMICSEFAARFAEHGGEIFDQSLPTVMPATIAKKYDVKI